MSGQRWTLRWILAAIVVLAGCANVEVAQTSAVVSPDATADRMRATVTWVIDGDTLELDGGERVRMLGIDTPEISHPRIESPEPYSWLAQEYLALLIEGKTVFLQGEGDRDRDRFGRLLRHVYLPLPDGGELFVEEEMVRAGFARAYDEWPDAFHHDHFTAIERQAREAFLGRWHSRKKKVELQPE